MFIFIIWYIIGLISLANMVGFKWKKIKEGGIWFYVGALFGPIVLLLEVFDRMIKD